MLGIYHHTSIFHSELMDAIKFTEDTINTVDKSLIDAGLEPLAQTIELANLSSMVGNLLGSGIERAVPHLYRRNGPHAYPDLIPLHAHLPELEIKVALETNMPKGHHPKPGTYLSFRYVLAADPFVSGKDNRGTKVRIWEARVGELSESDFTLSNTARDSGKTAVVKSKSLQNMTRVYFVPELLPYKKLTGAYS